MKRQSGLPGRLTAIVVLLGAMSGAMAANEDIQTQFDSAVRLY